MDAKQLIAASLGVEPAQLPVPDPAVARTLEQNAELLRGLEPREVWKVFEALLAIPRDSTKEEAAMRMLEKWADSHGFEHRRDEKGNRVIEVPGRGAGVTAESVMLQAHIDMVCVARHGKAHDFDSDPIALQRTTITNKRGEVEVLRAVDTTLGADNGVGVAMAMAAATDESITDCPPLEILITVEEEVNLKGAKALDVQQLGLKSRAVINLDSEEHGRITVGCAGGTEYALTWPVERCQSTNCVPVYLELSGCPGGHSAKYIAEERRNAITTLLELFQGASHMFSTLTLSEIRGGEKKNSIPANASAIVWIDPSELPRFRTLLDRFNPTDDLDADGRALNATTRFSYRETNPAGLLLPMERDTALALTEHILSIRHGPYSFSDVIPGAVETSNNVALIKTDDGSLELTSFTRSGIPHKARNIFEHTYARLHAADPQMTALVRGSYEPWEPRVNTKVLAVASAVFSEIFGQEPEVRDTHGGLELAYILSRLGPDAEAIAIGPEIGDPHGPDEYVAIDSTDLTYRFLRRTLTALAWAA